MKINNNGHIELNGITLYMGMPKHAFDKVIPGFTGNTISNRNGDVLGYIGYIENSLSGKDWEISLQVNIKRGLCAFYCRYIGPEFGNDWLGDEENNRKDYHKNFLKNMELKQKHYGFGYIRCSLNKSSRINNISLITLPGDEDPSNH